MSARVGRSARGVSHQGEGVSAKGVCSGGFCLGGCLPRGVYTSPCGQTDTCKNITFPQLLLRTVEILETNFTFTSISKV